MTNPENADSKLVPNHLLQEKSPYLLQHAFNPVSWYPWGKEALEKARLENKPIFLSVGYSTCHWCHVMESESFTDTEIAKILNKSFISIKVDREERPDIDQVYMETVMALTGAGGWPLNVFLTPDLKPFYGGTYFPPTDRHGSPAFSRVLLSIEAQWLKDADKLKASGENIAKEIAQHLQTTEFDGTTLAENIFEEAVQKYLRRFDNVHGGFGTAPKFPSSHNLSFLLQYGVNANNTEALSMVSSTLDAMARGGIWDHLGGGFHRYSTDERWHVPHFEKMLYDQALLARTYTEAYQVFGKPAYKEIADGIFDYVLQDLTSQEGAFLSAEDADSVDDISPDREFKEGAYYVWTHDELKSLLEPSELRVAEDYYGINKDGNVESDPFGEFTKKNVLHQAASDLKVLAQTHGCSPDELLAILKKIKSKMLSVRRKRQRPLLDDKILTDWNGLMIASAAYAARVFDDEKLREAAVKAADFILSRMHLKGGILLHRWREGEAVIEGFLDDYIFMAYALFEIYQSTFELKYLKSGAAILDKALDLFWDQKHSGFFFCSERHEALIFRHKPCYDSAMPSGNSLAVWVLAKYAAVTDNKLYAQRSEQTLNFLAAKIKQNPSGFPMALAGLNIMRGHKREVGFFGSKEEDSFIEMYKIAASKFAPGQIMFFESMDEGAADKISNFVKAYKKVFDSIKDTAALICENHVCRKPIYSAEELAVFLDDK